MQQFEGLNDHSHVTAPASESRGYFSTHAKSTSQSKGSSTTTDLRTNYFHFLAPYFALTGNVQTRTKKGGAQEAQFQTFLLN